MNNVDKLKRGDYYLLTFYKKKDEFSRISNTHNMYIPVHYTFGILFKKETFTDGDTFKRLYEISEELIDSSFLEFEKFLDEMNVSFYDIDISQALYSILHEKFTPYIIKYGDFIKLGSVEISFINKNPAYPECKKTQITSWN